eukprot:CAMPEP_0196579160 /NCGR_PEP_ID=MMETSP1081-20130531/17929_1 /TAXON_ID=36882 /ORGANISM="Pyramimonas amylifera, Strain CCMP720" /LENGTH=235 /DNA_ID=CAMNT_0041898633 /DNA_START=382 /DNA_END=1089 /DNA_ORIENTATION=-
MEEKISATNKLLRGTTAVAFREQIATESENNSIVDYTYLIQLAMESGQTNAEAEKLLEAMQTAGVVLRFHNAVYLRPTEIVDAVLDSLPLPTADNSAVIAKYEEKLQSLREEVGPLEKEMLKLHKKADSKARLFLWGGLFLISVQLFAFIRLTFWELSWDVMEPIAYFMQLFTAIIAYLWYMFHGKEMTNPLVYDKYYSKTKAKGMQGMGDVSNQYQMLAKQIQRYEQLLRWAKR